MKHGGAVRLDLACPVGGGDFRLGGALETEQPVRWITLSRLVATARLDVSRAIGPQGPWQTEAVLVAGWTGAARPGGGLLIAPTEGKGLQFDTNGPTVGLGVRLARHLTGAWSVDLRAEWRGALVEEAEWSVSRGIFGRTSRTLVHTFPITVGLALEL